jgi:hypothetical protein
MFRSDRNALPWHLKITQGAVQVNDGAQPTFSIAWPNVLRTLSLQGSRSWQESWTVVPEIDPIKLRALRRAYQDASDDNAFHKDFKEGTAPSGQPYGKYGSKYVWVQDGHLDALTSLTLKILQEAPVAAGERPLQLPGLPNR